MAVQAHYPSNILLLNRNGHDGNDYSLQPQPGGAPAELGFLDQSSPHMIFHNGGHVSRKRGRETAAVNACATPPAITNQSFSIHSSQQPSQHLSQLHRATLPNNISTGLRLSFSDNHQNNLVASHREELDQFLLSQGEELRRTLAEKRQKQYRELVGAAEERLSEKEAEVEKAARRNAKLEALAAQLSVEAQVWQAKARVQEAAAASLQVQLHQAIVAAPSAANHDCAGEPEDAESAYVDPDRVTAVSLGACRSCGRRVARVVVLPCRHLCLCTECDRVAQACPVCLRVRNSSVEVFLC